MLETSIQVVESSGLATIQDLGRPRHAHLGVPPSGALDPDALRLANRLVGNPPDAAGIEIVGTLRLRASRTVTVAITGAVGPAYGARPVPLFAPVPVRTLSLQYAQSGVRRYVAVAGGIAVEPVLGSRSTDTLSGLGPPPLKAGDTLPVGWVSRPPPAVDFVPHSAPPRQLRLGVTFGPRDDLFGDPARLLRSAYTVVAGDRIGARLDGPPLRRADLRDSEPVVTGAIQVPPDGRPLIFLNDHPTTGGYPVIAVVDAEDVPRLAQAGPGTSVTFRRSPRAAA